MWDEDTLHDIMMACIIMHNMIVEDERDDYEYNFNNKGQYVCNYGDMGERVSVSHDDAPCSARSVVAPSGKTIS
jgi:hypothetical protein